MDRQTVENIIAFLMRVDLKGREAAEFSRCISELQALIEKEAV